MKNICKIVEWNVQVESGYRSHHDMPMKQGADTLEQYKILGVNPRDSDDPKYDDDSKVSYNFEDVNFSIYGISRFAAHNGTMEVACDSMLYVLCFFELLYFVSCICTTNK